MLNPTQDVEKPGPCLCHKSCVTKSAFRYEVVQVRVYKLVVVFRFDMGLLAHVSQELDCTCEGTDKSPCR